MTKVIYYKNHEEEREYFGLIMEFCKDKKTGIISQNLPLISNLSAIENIALPISYHEGLTIKEVKLKAENLLEKYQLHDKIHYRKNQLNSFEEFIVKYIGIYLYNPTCIVFFNSLQALFGHHRKMFYDFLMDANTEKFVIIEHMDFQPLIKANISHKVVSFKEWVTLDLKV
jgi:ABC-type lipoprotein export system ATPase subunit